MLVITRERFFMNKKGLRHEVVGRVIEKGERFFEGTLGLGEVLGE